MSTSKRKKAARQAQHRKEKFEREYKEMLACVPKAKKEFVEYATPKPFISDTKEYPSLQTSDAIPGACAKRESMQYTGDLIVGIGTMHKSNLVPIMRGTTQAKDIAQMRR